MSSSSAAGLFSLSNELILEILKYCSVDSVLCVEKTCKALNRVCQDRAMWMDLIERLDINCAPSLDPFEPIESIPTPNLKRITINAIRKQRFWQDPEQHLEIRVVDFPFDYASEDASEEDEEVFPVARLLPGGKEMLTLYCGRVELWSLKTKERIWEFKSPRENAPCSFFDFDIVDGGSLLVVVICFKESIHDLFEYSIHGFDFRRRTTTTLLGPLPEVLSYPEVSLQGDYLIISAGTVVIMNWRVGEALTIVFDTDENDNFIPYSPLVADDEFIVFSNLKGIGDAVIRVPISDLSGHWSKATKGGPWEEIVISPWDDKFTVLPLQNPDSHVIEENEYDITTATRMIASRAFKPTWKANAPTEIFIVGHAFQGHKLVSYRLQLSRISPLEKNELKLINSASAETTALSLNRFSLSNSGQMFDLLNSKLTCFSLFTDSKQPMRVIELGKGVGPVMEGFGFIPNYMSYSVDPWSGVIVAPSSEKLKIISFV